MSHIQTLQAGIYTYLAFKAAEVGRATDTMDEIIAKLATGNVQAIPNIREFPEFGTPANVQNVPVYGRATSTQVNGQADMASMEFTINYVASEVHTDPTTQYGAYIGDRNIYPFMIALTRDPATSFLCKDGTGIAGTPTKANENSVFFFCGRLESLVVVPSVTDSYTAKLTISVATPIFGPKTFSHVAP